MNGMMDLDSLLSYLPIAILVIDALVILGFVFAIIGGLIKGLPKAMHNFIVVLISVIAFFCLLTPTTNFIATKEVNIYKIESLCNQNGIEFDCSGLTPYLDEDGNISISNTINYLVTTPLFPDGEVSSSKAGDFVLSVSTLVIRIIAYILCFILMLFIRLFLRIIFGIIRLICGIKLKNLPKTRILGPIPNVIKHLLNFIIIDLPLFGIMFFASDIFLDLKKVNDEIAMPEVITESIDAYCSAVDNSITKNYLIKPMSVVTKKSGMTADVYALNNILKFTYEDTDFGLCEEYYKIANCVPVAYKIYTQVSTDNTRFSFEIFTDEDIDALCYLVKEAKLAQALIPIGLEIAGANLEDESLKPYFARLNNINWKNEFNTLATSLGILKDYKDLELDFLNPNAMLKDKRLISFANEFLSSIVTLDLITEFAIPVMIEYIETNSQGNVYVSAIDFESLKAANWKENAQGLINFTFVVYEAIIDAEIDQDITNAEKLLNNKALPDTIDLIFNEINKLTFFKNAVVPALKNIIAIEIENNETLSGLLSKDDLYAMDLNNGLVQIGKAFSNILRSVQALELDIQDYKSILYKDNFSTELSKVIESILNVELISDYVLPIMMNKLLESLETNEQVILMNIDINALKSLNWKDEILSLKDVLIEIAKGIQTLNVDFDNLGAVLDHPSLKDVLQNIIDEALECNALKTYVVPNLSYLLNDLLNDNASSLGEFKDVIDGLVTEENMINLLQNDLTKVIGLMQDIRSSGILDNGFDMMDVNTQDTLLNAFKTILTLSIIDGKQEEIFTSLLSMSGLNTTLSEFGITPNFANVTSWDNEIDKIGVIFKNFMTIFGSSDFDFSQILNKDADAGERELIISTLSMFAQTEIFGDSMFTLIENLITSVVPSYEITFTDLDKNEIKNVTTWEVEIATIFDLLDEIQNIEALANMESLDSEVIRSIMTKASESVICSKILGGVLNTVLGSVVTYDLQDRNTMKACADVVCSAIDLSKAVLSPSTFDLNDKTQTDALLNNLTTLGSKPESIELANQLINQMTSENITVNTEDITHASTVLGSVIEAYQASEDQANFGVEDLDPSTIEELNNSELATILVSIFF